ncbi:MAG: hypothetical protein Q7J47_02105 [Azoarcus sp.]|nr:hypothetical protein [Azoarcus sp.]
MPNKIAPASTKFKIYQDEVKLAHTSHWDLDYLSQTELDALLAQERPADAGAAQVPREVPGKPGLKP